MATTIGKFYLHDAVTPNTGTMPSGAFISSHDSTGDATSARTARDATSAIGSLQKSSVITSLANVNLQSWGHRRFVSRPLAAQTIPLSGTWHFSYARQESNTNHNQGVLCEIYTWRPSTGAVVSANTNDCFGTEPITTSVEAEDKTTTGAPISDVVIQGGDILVFEISTIFTQGMSTAYTDTFFYDGTTEASITSCATFVSPPSPLILFEPSLLVPAKPLKNMLLRR